MRITLIASLLIRLCAKMVLHTVFHTCMARGRLLDGRSARPESITQTYEILMNSTKEGNVPPPPDSTPVVAKRLQAYRRIHPVRGGEVAGPHRGDSRNQPWPYRPRPKHTLARFEDPNRLFVSCKKANLKTSRNHRTERFQKTRFFQNCQKDRHSSLHSKLAFPSQGTPILKISM